MRISLFFRSLGVLAILLAAKAQPPALAAPTAKCEDPISPLERNVIRHELSKFDYAKADDAIQEALIAYLRVCREGEKISDPAAWIRVAAKRQLLNMKRDDKRQFRTDQAAALQSTNKFAKPRPAYVQIDRDMLAASRKLSESLDSDQLMALSGKWLFDMPMNAIAELEGVPVTTVQSRLRSGDRELSKVIAALPAVPTDYHTTPTEPTTGRLADSIALIICLALGASVVAIISAAMRSTRRKQQADAALWASMRHAAAAEEERRYRCYAASQNSSQVRYATR